VISNPSSCTRGFALALLFVTAIFCTANKSIAADAHPPFEGEKTSWHAGFDRYDFLMDDATGTITPMKAPDKEATSYGIDATLKDGKRRCVVVVPKKAAPGNPWSWQGCYWNHQPQTEVELLNRGFHIAYVAPDPGRQGKAWDRWYKFLTEEHGLSKKPAFLGMSKGGVNEFNWGVVNPEKVACIYADNPALYEEDFAKVAELAKHDVPLLHICGTEDFLLQHHTLAVENIYHQVGGSITVIVKEGHAHHPHSLQNATPIADWIEQHMQPSTANRPAFVDSTFTKSYYYSLEPSFIYLKEEQTYATARGPGFTESYDRYDAAPTGNFKAAGIAIIVPRNMAPGKPWVFRANAIDRDATVDLALLARGFHIVTPPLSAQAGMLQQQWDETYKTLVDNGFSKKAVMEAIGANAGELYAWAIANPDKVSSIYARNPSLRSLMARSPPIDNLAPLAKAGIPIIHDCGSLDPWLNDETRVVEKRYKELGGQITVIIREGEGHFPLAPKDPTPVVDFILRHQR
jgi:pimeloyl-ACP methyl ester carboxylesterase